MRINIDIHDKLMSEALKLTGLKTKREAVHAGLEMLVKMARQQQIRTARGKLVNRKQLIQEIEQLPEPFLDEIQDFVGFVKAKIARARMDTALASESSLKKDWLSAQEDAAWHDL